MIRINSQRHDAPKAAPQATVRSSAGAEPVLVNPLALSPAAPMAPLSVTGKLSPVFVASPGNPFGGLVAPTLVGTHAPCLAEARGLDKDLTPAAAVRVALLGLQRESAPQSAARSAAKLQEGMMLVVSDALPQHTEKSGIGQAVVSTLGEKLSAMNTETAKSEAKLTAHVQHMAQSMRSSFPMGMDVNAFVQAVLRESYMLQCMSLRDFGDRVEMLNDRRKAIRAKKREIEALLAKAKEEGAELPSSIEWTSFDDEKGFTPVAPKPEQDSEGDEASSETGRGTTSSSSTAESTASVTGTLTPELALLFGVRTRPGVSTEEPLASVVRNIQEVDSWGDRWSKINLELGGPDRGEAFRASLSSVRTLGEVDFVTLVECLLMREKRTELSIIVEHCTIEQLAWFSSWYGEDRLAEIDVLTGGKVQARRDALTTGTMDLPLAVTGDARLAEVVAMYHELRTQPENRDFNRARLESEMYKLPADAARVFLEAIDEDMAARGEDCAVFDGIFFACHGRALFEQGVPADWAFLSKTGGAAQRFYECWTGTAPDYGIRATQAAPVMRAAINVDTPAPSSERPSLAAEGFRVTVSGMGASDAANGASSETTAEATADQAGSLVTRENLEAYTKYLDEMLQNSDGDAQLANLDLQDALQRQQQTLQMMSNISKVLHDTVMAIIRNIGG